MPPLSCFATPLRAFKQFKVLEVWALKKGCAVHLSYLGIAGICTAIG
jgi:hypothetical protein